MNYSNNSSNEEWTYSENKQFENALAELDLNSPKLFENIKAIMPWKTVEQIKSHYQKLFEDVLMIERGEFGSLDYAAVDDDVDAGHPINRKGVPWTEEEHRLFLIGLKKLGKGEWRDISRYYVHTKTTSQVASHAQKYFRRLKCSTPLKKRRFSIHDIRILNSEIVETSPRNPSLHIVLAEIPPHSLLPPLSPHHNSFLQDNRLINHNHRNFFVVQKHIVNPAAFSSSAYQQVVTANNCNVISDDTDNTAPTTLTRGDGGRGSSSSSEMIMGNNNTNANNGNYSNNDDVYNMGCVDQYAYDADLLLCEAAVSPFWFPPPPNHDMPFY